MTDPRISKIKDKLAQDLGRLSREDVDWLIKRVEELEKQNEWLKKELTYAEYQGEVGY
ncbi:MAG: hypothetical protein ACOZFS_14835 [Thermodesulfobacteriota bacterium]